MQWHPIATAPDGPKHVLYGYLDSKGVLLWAVSGYCRLDGIPMNDAARASAFPAQPNHWSELPEKPNVLPSTTGEQ